LEVRKLHCPECDTSIEGRFALCRFCYLNTEQREFAETFIRCRGNIKEVERELGVSYPTVRSRLDAVIQALGYKVEPEEPAPADEARRKVLEALNRGEIKADEAVKLLKK
jgi:hypothetical protein